MITTTPRTYRRRTRRRNSEWYENPWLVGMAAIIALLGVIAVLLLFQPIERDLDDAQREMQRLQHDLQQVNVTRAEYDRILHGMSYREVVRIIGSNGEELSSNRIEGQGVIDDIHTEMYMWQNGDGSNMNAIFQNDRLIQKAQLGLP